jgi:branched-chain amino acid transport system ATP-binding protein
MPAALEVKNLEVRYGSVRALRGVDLRVEEGQIACVLGSNGAGKSSLLMAIAGAVPVSSGSIAIEGRLSRRPRPERLARQGVALVPERRRIFAGLTVEENLRLAALIHGRRQGEAELERVIERFPVLVERRRSPAGQLSGGEQQQLAIARALIAKPKLLLVDEPSLGLAPLIVDAVFEQIAELRGTGVSVLLVEQQVTRALAVSDHAYLLKNGEIRISGEASGEFGKEELAEAYLGIEGGKAGV